MRWHVNFSRLGFNPISLPLCATLAFWLLARAVRRRQWSDVAWAGLALGVGLHAYTGFRGVPVVAIVALVLAALLHRWPLRSLGPRLGVYLGAMALTATGAYIIGGALTAALLAGIAPPANAEESIRFLLNPWIWPSSLDLVLMTFCGCIAAFGFFCLSQGYRLSEAYRAAPCEYAALPWGVLWGYLFFGNTPDAVMILGALIIMGAGLYTLQPDAPAHRPS